MAKYYSEYELLNNMYDIVDEDGCILTVLDEDTLKSLPPLMPVRQLVHAHWIETEDLSGDHYVECSNCCLHWWISGESSKEAEMNYCPRCGAKMDEEVE